MKNEWFTLTKEEFIKRSMKGESFEGKEGGVFYYDKNEDATTPFKCKYRLGGESRNLSGLWSVFKDGEYLFKTHKATYIKHKIKSYPDGKIFYYNKHRAEEMFFYPSLDIEQTNASLDNPKKGTTDDMYSIFFEYYPYLADEKTITVRIDYLKEDDILGILNLFEVVSNSEEFLKKMESFRPPVEWQELDEAIAELEVFNNDGCVGCKHHLSDNGNFPIEPCGECSRFYADKFERKEDEN